MSRAYARISGATGARTSDDGSPCAFLAMCQETVKTATFVGDPRVPPPLRAPDTAGADHRKARVSLNLAWVSRILICARNREPGSILPGTTWHSRQEGARRGAHGPNPRNPTHGRLPEVSPEKAANRLARRLLSGLPEAGTNRRLAAETEGPALATLRLWCAMSGIGHHKPVATSAACEAAWTPLRLVRRPGRMTPRSFGQRAEGKALRGRGHLRQPSRVRFLTLS